MACTEATCLDCPWYDTNCAKPYSCPNCGSKNVNWVFDEELDHYEGDPGDEQQ